VGWVGGYWDEVSWDWTRGSAASSRPDVWFLPKWKIVQAGWCVLCEQSYNAGFVHDGSAASNTYSFVSAYTTMRLFLVKDESLTLATVAAGSRIPCLRQKVWILLQ